MRGREKDEVKIIKKHIQGSREHKDGTKKIKLEDEGKDEVGYNLRMIDWLVKSEKPISSKTRMLRANNGGKNIFFIFSHQ